MLFEITTEVLQSPQVAQPSIQLLLRCRNNNMKEEREEHRSQKRNRAKTTKIADVTPQIKAKFYVQYWPLLV